MAKYACSIEGIQELKECSSRILDGGQIISEQTNTIRQIVEDYPDTLGPHQSDLISSLDNIASAIKECVQPVNSIASLLLDVAEGYQEVVDTNLFDTTGERYVGNFEKSGETVTAGNPYRERWEKFAKSFSNNTGTDGWDSLKEVPFYSEKNDISTENALLGNFETDKHINGSDSFVKGCNYDQFKKDYYSSEGSTYITYDTPKEATISPSMIEGIHLGKNEVEDPSVFWSQHEKGGTLESFMEIASHIPEVKEQLMFGKTIDELLDDPMLSECTSIYFVNPPRVIDNGDYYEFSSNGRHRILAAREVGYDIPVKIIGRRDRKA